jgi:hypothetical protein
MRYSLFLLSAFVLGGCAMTEEKFEEKYAEAYCDWLDGCSKVSDRHGTMEDCLTAQKIEADEMLTPDGCTFEPKQAKACIKEIKNNDECVTEESVPDECLSVSNCTQTDTGA